MRLSATLSSGSVPVSPGGRASVPVEVRNAGDTVEAYDIDVVGVPAGWVSVEPPTITLYPATTGSVTVTFSPPRSAGVPAGEMPFGVHIVPAEHPEAAALEEGTLQIEPFEQLDARLRPPTRTGRIGARYSIDVANRGNITEQVRLTSEDSTRQLAISPAAAAITVPNDTESRLRQRVRARRLLWWGQPRELLFTTQVRRDGDEVTVLDGRFVQRPIISAGLLKALAALLALLLALLALWFGLLRPAVKSAAKEAADDATDRKAQQVPLTPPAQEPSAPAGSGAGGSRGAGSQGQGQGGNGQGGNGAAGDVRDQFSAAVSFRTSPNGSASQGYTVPDGKVFLLTDFLVDNVQGDEGTLVVTANGVRVVTLALENFRNQDYHSVTPIRVPAKAQVTLTVACRRAGTPANARPATTCSESLYLNGIMSDAPTP